MTTVVYKDGVMVCDGRVTAGDSILYEDYCKIHVVHTEIETYLIGVAGQLSQVEAFLLWAAEDFDEEHRPKKGLEESAVGGLTALVVKKTTGCLYNFEAEGFIDLGKRHGVLGSGADPATAALILGQTPADAVRLAAKMDTQTNDTIFEITVEEAFTP